MASMNHTGSGGSSEEDESFLDWDGRQTLFDEENEEEEEDEDDEDREEVPKAAKRSTRRRVDPDEIPTIDSEVEVDEDDEEEDEADEDLESDDTDVG